MGAALSDGVFLGWQAESPIVVAERIYNQIMIILFIYTSKQMLTLVNRKKQSAYVR
jgi:hypothetical protein